MGLTHFSIDFIAACRVLAGKFMRLDNASKTDMPANPCPVCGIETSLLEIAPHPLHVKFDVHGYLCEQCGPVKSMVVLRTPVRKLI
ncbi:MAG: hypothetical protein ABW198_08580 [Pseudorhodoplanes sp.]